MILTCPECATSYFVDDARIPPEGRTVKCATCGARWHADHETPEAGSADDTDIFAEVGSEPPNTYAPSSEAALPDDDIVAVEPDAPVETGLRKRPAAAMAAAARRAPAKRDNSAVFIWGGMAAVVALMVGATLVFRQDVVQLWPQSSKAFQGLGLKVNGTGLVIQEIKAEPNFLGGRPVLAVTGSIRNIRPDAIVAPAIRISLLDRAGKPVAAKVARPLNAEIPAHSERHFAVAILDPPANAHDLEVTFDLGDAKSAQAARPAPPAHAPAPVEAQPLPAGAPEALPDHG
jgi:predicted Zn finger-like uncharacterized protein